MELNELRKTAEEATQGNWMWVNDRDDERIRAGKFPYHHVTYTDDVVDENALYIATFDPPTVLALLSRLEQAEQAVQRVREMATELRDTPASPESPKYARLLIEGAQAAGADMLHALEGDGRG